VAEPVAEEVKSPTPTSVAPATSAASVPEGIPAAEETSGPATFSMKPDFSEKSRFKTAPKTTVKLTDLLKVEPKKEQTDANQAKVDPDEPFTPEQLQAVWNEFAELRKKFQAEYHLLTQPYDLKDNVVTVHLHNSVQEMMLNGLRIELSTFVREKLKNNSIQIYGELKEVEDVRKVIYTNREKFDYLIEKNPILRELKDRLGLDTDY
jgi:DNA polymerase-3 subunit gamma/tau